jgi:glycerol-3-phosphate cytidylyltransferase
MRRVLTYGTFDLLHWGHIRLLMRAKALGDYLIVAASTDEFAVQQKRVRAPYHQFDTRCDMLEAVRYVDLVIEESSWEQKIDDIRRYHVDTVVMGSDWRGSSRFEHLRNHCELVYLPRTPGISTSKIRRDLLADAVTVPGAYPREPAPLTAQLSALPRSA